MILKILIYFDKREFNNDYYKLFVMRYNDLLKERWRQYHQCHKNSMSCKRNPINYHIPKRAVNLSIMCINFQKMSL